MKAPIRIPPAWAGLLAFTWFFGILLLYYAGHKPFTVEAGLALGTALFHLAAAGAVLSLAGGLGSLLLPASGLHLLERLPLQAAAGLGMLGLAWLGIGAAGGFRAWIAWGILLAGLALLHRPTGAWLRGWRAGGPALREAGKLGKLLAAGIGLLALLALLSALAPPLKFDALVYHLALPHTYALAGRMSYQPQLMFWGMPQQGEMLYTWAILLGGAETASVLGWFVGILALTGLGATTASRLGGRAGWAAAASLVGGFSLANALGWGYVDWLAILYGWACLAACAAWLDQAGRGWLWLSGALAGCALGTKYTAGILIPAGAALILWLGPRPRSRAVAGKDLLAYLAGAGLVFAPWLVKNWLATGSPVYPLLVPAGAMDRFRLDLYQNGQAWGSFWDAILLPVRLTFWGQEMAPGYSAAIGPLLVGLSAAAGIGMRAAPPPGLRVTRAAAVFAGAGLLIWMAAGRFSSYLLQARLYYAIFPALAILAGAGFAALDRLKVQSLRLGWLAGWLVVLVGGMNLLEVGAYTLRQDPAAVLFGQQNAKSYLAANLGWYAAAMEKVRDLPEGARVLLLWEPRSLYCLPKCDPDEVLDRWLVDLHQAGSAGGVLSGWRAQGYTHILVFHQGAEFERANRQRYPEESWQILEDLLAGLPMVDTFGDAYQLYQVSP